MTLGSSEIKCIPTRNPKVCHKYSKLYILLFFICLTVVLKSKVHKELSHLLKKEEYKTEYIYKNRHYQYIVIKCSFKLLEINSTSG